MGTRSFPGVKYGWGVLLTTHHLLVPQSWKSRAIPLPTFWATTRPVTETLYLYVAHWGRSDINMGSGWGNLKEKKPSLKAEPIWEDNVMDLKNNGMRQHGLD
jgi:hypothetical protein